MHLFKGISFDVIDYFLHNLHNPLRTVNNLVCQFVLDDHKLLPALKSIFVRIASILSINRLQERCKYVNKLIGHQEVSHSFDDIVMATDRQHHVIDPLLEDRINDADGKDGDYIDISHHLENGVIREKSAY